MRPISLLAIVCCVAASVLPASAATPTISQLFVFTCNANFSSCPDGMDPTLIPVQLADGNLYGVTWWAGQGNSNAGGTVWKVTPSGQGSVVHTFQPGRGGQFLKGENPVIGFAQGAHHSLYGVTESGGTAHQGVMYRVTPSGQFKILHNFCTQNCQDIQGSLILGADGNFYGIQFGGPAIFKITPAGVYSVVHTLDPGTEGRANNMFLGKDGNFYGTGALGNACRERGTVFKMTPSGQFTVLTSFGDLELVRGNLVQATDGNFYGAVYSGGGTSIFRLTPSGSVANIYTLQNLEGFDVVNLLQGSDGNLWGLTTDGGPQPARPGAVFTITLQGSPVADAFFDCNTTGCTPSAMIQGADGALYGIAQVGGNAGAQNAMGTLFKIEH